MYLICAMFFCCANESPPGEEAKITEALPPLTEIQEEPAMEAPSPVVEEPQPDAAPEPQAVPVVEPAPAPEPTPTPEPEPAPVEQEAPKEAEQPKGDPEFTEWEVNITKEQNVSLGILLDCNSPNTLAVKDVKTVGPVAQWNAANADRKVVRGDAVMAVNGALDKREMLDKLKKESSLTVLIRRMPEFVIQVDKSAGPLGITFPGSGDIPAQVSAVNEGKSIAMYNKGAEPGKLVTPGHILIEVNGEAGNLGRVVQTISRASGTLTLKFRHAAVGA